LFFIFNDLRGDVCCVILYAVNILQIVEFIEWENMRYINLHYDRGFLGSMRDEGWCLMSLGLCNVLMLVA